MSGRGLVALDLDGTLEDSRADMVAAIAVARASLGLPPRPPGALLPWVYQGMPRLYAHAFDDARSAGLSTERVAEAYASAYGAGLAVHTVPYPGIPRALRALEAEGWALAVVTNKPEALSERLLELLGLRRHFGAIIGGDTCTAAKPDPVMLEAAVAQIGVSRERVVMVGDTAGDVRLARAFGCPAVWCAWGYRPSADPEVPDELAWEPSLLPEAVRRAAARWG